MLYQPEPDLDLQVRLHTVIADLTGARQELEVLEEALGKDLEAGHNAGAVSIIGRSVDALATAADRLAAVVDVLREA